MVGPRLGDVLFPMFLVFKESFGFYEAVNGFKTEEVSFK